MHNSIQPTTSAFSKLSIAEIFNTSKIFESSLEKTVFGLKNLSVLLLVQRSTDNPSAALLCSLTTVGATSEDMEVRLRLKHEVENMKHMTP